MSGNFSAFTLKSNNILSFIRLEVGVSKIGTVVDGVITKTPEKFWGIWSTGACQSYISDRVIEKMQLEPDFHNSNSYRIDFFLPNNIHVAEVLALKIPYNKEINYDITIGMEIITQGDMSLSNKNGITTFSFRVPSIGGVDFVELHNQMYKKPKLSIVGVEHNQICPCGSGKKYKNCCEKRK